MDYLQHIQLVPPQVREVLDRYQDKDETYPNCKQLEQELNQIGWTINWGLEAEPFNLRPMPFGESRK